MEPGPYDGYWDRDRIEQVMNNLIGNAIKYSPPGGTVTVRTKHDDDFLLIGIRDEGIGIPEDEQRHLFERFYRGSAEGGNIKGLGLGLYVTQRIVDAHGGSVGLQSKQGEGSEFYFTLPLLPVPAALSH
jgi:signal transduction histidine kinase